MYTNKTGGKKKLWNSLLLFESRVEEEQVIEEKSAVLSVHHYYPKKCPNKSSLKVNVCKETIRKVSETSRSE